MGIYKNNGKESKGFVGFSNLVPDVTVELEPRITEVTRTAEPTTETQAQSPASTLPSAYHAPVSTNSGGSKECVHA